MKLFTSFFLYIVIGLAIYFLLSIWKKRCNFAFRLFFFTALLSTFVLSAIALAKIASGSPLHPLTVISTVMVWVGWLSLLALGYCLGYITIGGYKNDTYVFRGLSIQFGITFVVAVIEAMADLADIKKFFLTSGYSVPFLYLVYAIQLVCGTLLLFNLRFYPKLLALILLLAVMLGAVVTHIRRGDPFNYAIAAIELSFKLIIALWLYLLYKRNAANY
jgi:DoxX-like family